MSESAGQEPEVSTIDGRTLLTSEERSKMISRIHSLVYWVGMLIPEHEVLAGTEIDLREVVYDLTNKEVLTTEDVKRANQLIDLLRSKERGLEEKLSHDQMTLEAAKGMLEEVCGLLRAIDELRSAESIQKAEFNKKQLMTRVEDAKRWQKFVESIKPPKS